MEIVEGRKKHRALTLDASTLGVTGATCHGQQIVHGLLKPVRAERDSWRNHQLSRRPPSSSVCARVCTFIEKLPAIFLPVFVSGSLTVYYRMIVQKSLRPLHLSLSGYIQLDLRFSKVTLSVQFPTIVPIWEAITGGKCQFGELIGENFNLCNCIKF